MRTKRKIAREILEQMRAVYVHINSVPSAKSPGYWDAYDYIYGHYNGLRDAYQALTGQSEPGITRGIEDWFAASEEFRAERV